MIDHSQTAIIEHYCQALGSLVVALSDQPELLRPTVVYVITYNNSSFTALTQLLHRAYLSSGTQPSVLSSHVMRAVLRPEEGFDDPDGSPNLFQKLEVLRTVAQKVLESAANDKPIISKPAREAREVLREMDDPNLRGLF